MSIDDLSHCPAKRRQALQRHEEAAEDYRQVVSLQPQNVDAKQGLEMLLTSQQPASIEAISHAAADTQQLQNLIVTGQTM